MRGRWSRGGLLVAYRHLHRPVDPPGGITARPGRERNTGRRDDGGRCGLGRPCVHAAQFPAVFGASSVHQQSGGYPSCYTETGPHSAVVQKTVEIPQLQFLGLVVVPVLCTDKCWYKQCRKLWNCRRCSSCGVVDVTVIMQRLFQQSSRSTECWTFQLCHSSS